LTPAEIGRVRGSL